MTGIYQLHPRAFHDVHKNWVLNTNNTRINNDNDAFPCIVYSDHTGPSKIENARRPIVIKSEEDEKSGLPTGVGCGPHKTICGLLSKVRHLHLLKVLNWLPSQTRDWKNNDKLRRVHTDADMGTVK